MRQPGASPEDLTEDEQPDPAQLQACTDALLNELRRQNFEPDWPLACLVRHQTANLADLYALFIAALKATRAEEIRSTLAAGNSLGNVRPFVYAQSLFMILVHQPVGIEALVAEAKQHAIDVDMFYVLVRCPLGPCSEYITGIDLGGLDLPDYLASQELAGRFLKLFYNPEKKSEIRQLFNRLLVRLKLMEGTTFPLPVTLPTTKTACRELLDQLQMGPHEFVFRTGASTAEINQAEDSVRRALPDDLKAFHASFARIGSQWLIDVTDLPLLQADFAADVRRLNRRGENLPPIRVGDLDVRSLPMESALAVGETSSGDWLFVSPQLKSPEDQLALLRLWHDRPGVATVQAGSLWTEASRQFLLYWGAREGMEKTSTDWCTPNLPLPTSRSGHRKFLEPIQHVFAPR